MKFVAEVPARLGSKRVPAKNLRAICGKPLIAYAIEACQGARGIDEVYVNTESDLIALAASAFGAKVYKRREELAEDHVVSDQFNYDFLKNVECDAVVMVNPVSPLVESSDIEGAMREFVANRYDTLISVREERLHSFFQGRALNFSTDGLLPMTQKIEPLQVCVWCICIWRKSAFVESFETKGHAVFCGKVGMYPIEPIKALKISYEAEFEMAERLIGARSRGEERPCVELR